MHAPNNDCSGVPTSQLVITLMSGYGGSMCLNSVGGVFP
jgi:hypothetical protein